MLELDQEAVLLFVETLKESVLSNAMMETLLKLQADVLIAWSQLTGNALTDRQPQLMFVHQSVEILISMEQNNAMTVILITVMVVQVHVKQKMDTHVLELALQFVLLFAEMVRKSQERIVTMEM